MVTLADARTAPFPTILQWTRSVTFRIVFDITPRTTYREEGPLDTLIRNNPATMPSNDSINVGCQTG